MGLSAITYALSKKYTDETAAQFGGLKGASCQIQSAERIGDQTFITFAWENSYGKQRTTKIAIDNGTPIYTWTPGMEYKYGDLAIYESAFYRCTTANSDTNFDNTKWNEIGSPDGNYDIVQSSSYLPPRFTPADRKMYYSIEDWCFYLWDGSGWVRQKQAATYENLGLVKVNEETLEVNEEGEISVRTITDEQVEGLFNQ